jgi:hypothetical protein
MESRCLIAFAGTISLPAAANALEDAGLDVVDHGGHLAVSWGEPLSVGVSVLAPAEAQQQLARLNRADVLAQCNSCIAIEISELDDALDDANLLIEVQATLEELTSGWTVNAWNNVLSRGGEEI